MKTIEEKAKAYDEALERAKQVKLTNTKENVAAAEYIFPDLKESEDERMMREFNDWLCEEIECRTNDLRDEKDRRTLNMLCYVLTKVKDWPERQKEHVPENEESGTRKEQKPIEFKNDELVEIIKGEFEGFRRLLKKKGIDYEPQYGYWEGLARLFDSSAREYVKEQKPNPLCGSTEEYYREAYYADQPQKEQKPAEWSEEDEKMLNGIIGRGCSQIPHTEPGLRGEQIDWLKNRLKSLRPQPKQEWSEEDESILEALIYDIERLPVQGVLTHRSCDSYIKFLKALRPGWKPSEEQMRVLLDALNPYYLLGDGSREILKSLYEQLKKL